MDMNLWHKKIPNLTALRCIAWPAFTCVLDGFIPAMQEKQVL